MYVYVFGGLSEKQASRLFSNSEISGLISYEYNGILYLIHSMLPDCIVICQKYSRFIGFYRQYAASIYGKEDTIPTGKEDNWPNTITALAIHVFLNAVFPKYFDSKITSVFQCSGVSRGETLFL